jgi:hypothetical protein
MIRKSGIRFSEKIMLKQKLAGGDGTFCDWILGCGGGAASCREAM